MLRHQPDKINLNLDENGWTDVDELLQKLPFTVSFEKLKEVVDTNDKKRFAFSDDFSKIRANQGHSISVNLDLPSLEPPEFLFHGTAEKYMPSISEQGLKKRQRHHVHLSADLETAKKVGIRHGKLVILKVASGQMHKDGFQFFHSENGVWLVDEVPTKYFRVEKD